METGGRPKMSGIRELLDDLSQFESTPEAVGYELRLDLADIVLRRLRELGWTQAQLADAAHMQSPFVTRIVHSAQNCTFDVAGRLLHALGAKAKLVEAATSCVETTNTGYAYVEESAGAVEQKTFPSASGATNYQLRIAAEAR